MIPDLWWNNKCRRYAQKLRDATDFTGRPGTARGQILRVHDELVKASNHWWMDMPTNIW